MNLPGLTDSIASVSDAADKCRECGATTRLGNGLCLSCTLREGLELDREESRESFEAILVEDDVHDTHWRVGNYEILEEIGRGGMGVIYRARQRHSRRIVALKRMVSYHADSRETLERFRREAEAAASLDHPNILPIYEVGRGEDGLPFFSMKYAAGGSLQKAGPALRNNARECTRLMAKVARAVQYAHEHGVLHRDLKPGNILLDGRGEPFVTDFGLAKWLDTETDLTRTLTIFGTPGYIAPEQAKGAAEVGTPGCGVRSAQRADPTIFAADVYSLGAILFDLSTGRPPFLGEHALAVIQQASEKPAPKLRSLVPSLDRDLETICARCLEREPETRYRSAADLADDLERWLEGRPIIARPVSAPVRAWRWSRRNRKLAAATAAAFGSVMAAAFLFFSHNRPPPQSNPDSKLPATSAQVETMAILPFKVVSADPADEYLGTGLADTLVTQIGRMPQILVRTTSSSKHAGSPGQDPLATGRLLGVEAVLDGTVQHEVGNVRVTARLLRVPDGAVLWSAKFDEKFTNVFAIQDAISQDVAKTLIPNVTDEDRKLLTKRHTDNPEAYRAYLKGRYFWNKRTPAALQQSLEFFRQALDLDPTYASAYAGMADAYALLVWQEQLPRDEFIARAKAAATKALEIDQTLAEPHATLGYVKFWYDWDFAGAESEFRRAIDLNPDSGTAHHWYGESLGMMGRFAEGIKELRLAQQVDPLSPIINADLGKLLFLARQPDQAIEQLQKTLQLDPDLPLAHVFLALAWNKKGLHEQAIAELERIAKARGSRAIFKATLGFVYGQSGREPDARSILGELIRSRSSEQYVSPFHVALVYVGLGEKDKATEWLETAKTERDPFLIYINVDPNFDSLRDDSRFAELAGWLLRQGSPGRRAVSVPEKSIAVLPFENLSEEKKNAFFADGVQDELLTDLSRIADLKVISRASVMHYKTGIPRNVREIGQQLGVANVVEGSVQRSGNRVRVNAQLVDARTDRHLWAQTYDRDLADVFAIESELAKTIADQLQAKLSPTERKEIERAPTSDITAFDLYTRAKNLSSRLGSITGNQRTNDLHAVNLLNQAVARDPSFFDAYCELAQVHDGLYVLGYDHTSARLALADAAVEAASQLRPDAGETHLARAQNLYQGYLDYAGALAELELARQSLPNDSRIFLWKGLIERRQGRWEQSINNLGRAIELDPRNFFLLDQTAQSYQALRHYAEEKAIYARILALEPDEPVAKVTNALIELNSKADTRPSHQIIDSIKVTNPAAVPSVADAWLLCSLAERNAVDAKNALIALGENPINLASVDNVRFNRPFFEGVIARMTKDEGKTQSAFSAARAEQERIVQAEANYGLPLCVLGLIDAGLGRKDKALREAQRAVELVPREKDALDGSAAIKYLAMIAACVGNKDLAFEKLATAIRTPSGLSYGQLKLLPFWDPLRADPRFSKLLDESQEPIKLK